MTIIAYPVGLPTFLFAGKSRNQPAQFTESNPRRGPSYTQKIGSDMPVFWDVTFRFNEDDAQRFQLWVKLSQYLDNGLNEFILPIKTEFGLVDHTCRFLSTSFLDTKQDSQTSFTYNATIMARKLVVPQSYLDNGDYIVTLPDWKTYASLLDVTINQEWPTVEYIDIVKDGVLHEKAIFTRASSGTTEITQGTFTQAAVNEPRYRWSYGYKELLIEEGRTNLVFPSDVGVTQTRTVTSTAHTLSFKGTGSVALSGASIGSLVGTGINNLVSLTFTPSAGNLTVTVTGSVTEWQLEAGSFYTSRIVTTSASATRDKDFAKINKVDCLINAGVGSFLCGFSAIDTSAIKVIVGAGGSQSFLYLFVNERLRYTDDLGATATIETTNSAFLDRKNMACVSYGNDGILMSMNSGTISQGSKIFLLTDEFISIGSRNGGSMQINSGISTMRYYLRKLSASEMQALTS